MVALFDHCTFNLNPRATSIDTPLHAFVPARHVDHVHADAVIAIAASTNAEELTKEIYGAEIGFLPWQRPGFDLGLKLGEMASEHPEYVGVVLGGHGLFTWGPTSKSLLRDDAAHHPEGGRLARRATRSSPPSAARASPRCRRRRGAKPRRGCCRRSAARSPRHERKVGHFSDAPEVLEFVNSNAMADLAPLGTSCPDHFLRTKIRPLVLPFDPGADNLDDGRRRASTSSSPPIATDYAAYYDRCKRANSPAMRDPNAVIYLVPGVGMLSFAKDKATARIASEFYVNAINVMRGASGVSTLCRPRRAGSVRHRILAARGSQAAAHAEAEIARRPRRADHRRRRRHRPRDCAARMLSEGACVVARRHRPSRARRSGREFRQGFRQGRRARRRARRHQRGLRSRRASPRRRSPIGGLDIVVSNAGIASASPIEDTSLALWEKNVDILSTGYFLVSREAFRLWLRQGCGGNLVFVASKNGLAASPGASAYCAAKASEIHLARCLALEGAPHGIRVNTVNPDAVLRGSKIWQGEWRQQRAAVQQGQRGGLEEVYRQRSMLKLSVFPEDIAEGVYFFVSDASAKSTGNILNVDAGNVQSFTR